MAKKGFIHTVLFATIAALLSFFLLYFFSPSMSAQFLGVSFSTRQGSANAQVSQAVENAVQNVTSNPEFSKESLERLQSLLQSQEVQDKLKAAAKQGEQALKDSIKTVTDAVK